MKLVNNAILVVRRKPIQFITLLITITLVIVTISSSFKIKNAIGSIKENVEETVGVYISVKSPVNGYGLSYVEDLKTATEEYVNLLESIDDYDHVKYSSFSYLPFFSSFATLDISSAPEGTDQEPTLFVGINNPGFFDFNQSTDVKLISGRNFTKDEINNGDYKIIIPENTLNFEKKDFFKVGDSINIVIKSMDGMSNSLSRTFSVIGITDKGTHSSYACSNGNGCGFLFLTNSTIQKFSDEIRTEILDRQLHAGGIGYMTGESLIQIDNYNNLGKVVDKIKENIPQSEIEYQVVTSEDDMLRILEPLNNLGNLGEIVLYGGLILGFLVITLNIFLYLHSRIKNVAILLSLGAQKMHIIMQVVVEMIIVSLFAIPIGILLSNIVSVNILSKSLASNDLYQLSSEGMQKVVQSMNAISVTEVVLISVFTFAIMAIASIIPLLKLSKTNPKRILK